MDKLQAYAVAKGHASRAGPTQALKETLEALCADEKNVSHTDTPHRVLNDLQYIIRPLHCCIILHFLSPSLPLSPTLSPSLSFLFPLLYLYFPPGGVRGVWEGAVCSI